jgi:hypothetical protein
VTDPHGSLEERFRSGITLPQLLERTVVNRELWLALFKRAQAGEATVERVRALGGQWHFLVLSEDWCGDSVNVLPVIERLAAAAGNLDMRIVSREENPDLMEAHLTNGSRSIPVVIVLDSTFAERGWWGPRPAELQRWMVSEGKALPNKAERYRHARGWYARDRGESTLEETVALLERLAGDASPP